MRRIRAIAFLLVVVLLASALAGCNGDGPEDTKATLPEDGPELDSKWIDLDFKDEDLIININVKNPTEQTFLNAAIYERGPASIAEATDTVSKMIYDRNITIAEALDVNVVWEETDLGVGLNLAVIDQFVKLNPDNTPDIFISKAYDIIHAMLTGALYNVRHNYGEESPADGKVNYFDFDVEGWYTEYMQGTTVRQDKTYMVAGDYFVDMIRWSYVIYVNRMMFDELGIMGYDMDYLYADVVDRAWDYEWFTIFIEGAGRDGDNDGVYDAQKGEQVGYLYHQLTEVVFTATNGLSVIGWEGELYNSKPYIIENNSEFFNFSNEFNEFYNAKGIMNVKNQAILATTLFLEGNLLFTLSKMGEMESEQVRESEVQKGLLPVPLYDNEKQEDYITLVHDQADIGCILNNVRRFSAATAYLQLANETSVPILKEYYEKTLKLKYTDGADDKAMIDLIHDRIVSPFEHIITRLVVSGDFLPDAPYKGEFLFNIVLHAADGTAGFQSAYAAGVDGWKKNLERTVEVFDALP